MPALTALLKDIVDYAGLFPPAGLALPSVVRNYSQYTVSPHAWMLGRLIVPVGQLESLAEHSRTFWANVGSNEILPWKISCLMPTPNSTNDSFASHWKSIAQFNDRHPGRAVVVAVETKADSVDDLQRGMETCDPAMDVFWELPHSKPIDEFLSALRSTGGNHRAKIRTGGVQPEMIATAEDVARFLSRCAATGVAFKATAGLHHPIRNEYALTYDVDSPCATMHGFLNVFVAAVMAWAHQLSERELLPMLTCRDPRHFELGGDQVVWRDMKATIAQVESARNDFAFSFGSCSFVEPIEELLQMGLLRPTKELTI